MRMVGRIVESASGVFVAGFSLEPDDSLYVGSEPVRLSCSFSCRREAARWLETESKRVNAPLFLEVDDEIPN